MQQRPGIMGGGGSGLGGALATGMAMGAGSAIAHEAIRGVMGSGGHGGQQQMAPPQGGAGYAEPQQQQQMMAQDGQFGGEQIQQQQQNPCMNFNQYLLSCLKDNTGNIGLCQANMDLLTQCEKDNSRYFMGM